MSSFLILCNNKNHFSIGLWHVMKSGLYMTTSDDQLSGWTKKLQGTSQSQICTKKRGHGHCLVVCWWSDSLQLSESQWNHYIWELCSANWWDALKTATLAAGIAQQKGLSSSPWQFPTTHHTTKASKVERIGLQSFVSSAIFIWPLVNQQPLLQASWQLLAGKALPQPAEGRKCFPRVCWILKHGFLFYKEWANLFLIAKNVLIVIVPILINKDVFEPSYNHLKFTVQNHSYFCTNIINATFY